MNKGKKGQVKSKGREMEKEMRHFLSIWEIKSVKKKSICAGSNA